jgi:hypothetical protein
MKLTADKVLPIVLTLDLEEKEKLFKMIEFDLKKANVKKKKEIGLDRDIQEYLIRYFQRSYERNKLKKGL